MGRRGRHEGEGRHVGPGDLVDAVDDWMLLAVGAVVLLALDLAASAALEALLWPFKQLVSGFP